MLYLEGIQKGKFDVKGDEGIFLGYSYKRKAYKCLNLSTHKIIESAHVRIDEFVEKSEEESNKELEDYRIFIYYEPNTLLEEREIITLEITKLQRVQTKSQSQTVQLELEQEGTKLEGTELLPKQIEIEDTELVLDQTELEEPKLQLV